MVKTVFNYNKKRFWASILLAQFVLFRLMSKNTYLVEIFQKFYDLKKDYHNQFFKNLPISVGDLLYVFFLIGLITYLLYFVFKRKALFNFKYVLVTINIIFFLYHILWSMMYFTQPIKNKLPQKEITTKTLKLLTEKYLEKTIQARKKVKNDNDGSFKISNLQKIKEEIIHQQNVLPKNIIHQKPLKNYNLKESTFGTLMNYSGILGYYNPFTSEAQYNPNLPDTYIPFTLAHETAHQYGLAKEQEANFFAFLIGNSSSNPDLYYSTQYYVLKSLLNALKEYDEEYVENILLNYSEEMKKDRNKELKFRHQYKGIMDDFFGFTNDLFLKSNQQDGSITYSYFLQLLVQYENMDI